MCSWAGWLEQQKVSIFHCFNNQSQESKILPQDHPHPVGAYIRQEPRPTFSRSKLLADHGSAHYSPLFASAHHQPTKNPRATAKFYCSTRAGSSHGKVLHLLISKYLLTRIFCPPSLSLGSPQWEFNKPWSLRTETGRLVWWECLGRRNVSFSHHFHRQQQRQQQ